ncbi:MAG: arsenate reductase ArsC [Planctomycetes bacterium]|nr:arsenate reductase ArsC [Planctomycetota bacterium]
MAAPKRILFLCTANACRSQLAEAILRHDGGEGFEALSAGSRPAGFVHQLALDALEQLDITPGEQRSKSWEEFAHTPMDAVITLCDSAAEESCPVWPGDPLCAHWSLPDPAYFPGSDEERLHFAVRVAERLRTKIAGLIDMDWSAPREELARRLAFLGEI